MTAAPKPTVEIGGARLYLGNALDILPGLRGLDLLATDAPYRLTSGGGMPKSPGKMPSVGAARMSGKFNPAFYCNDGNLVACDIEWRHWLPLAFAALRADADAYLMANDKAVFEAYAAAMASGFKIHNLLVWDKAAVNPNRWYMKACEFVLYCWKGQARVINDPSSSQIMRVRAPRGLGPEAHPTPKPPGLMAHFIRNSSDPGDVVLDPFMGTGATGLAAVSLGRRFVGIEIKRRWFDQAVAKLEGFKQPELMMGSA